MASNVLDVWPLNVNNALHPRGRLDVDFIIVCKWT